MMNNSNRMLKSMCLMD